ncbi:MAG: radical SAM family heme chaperone HemW [Cyanobacteriota bacterium]|nr:radical SAM family heme chaperone HemW [Cyanobacteriota bacterium]
MVAAPLSAYVHIPCCRRRCFYCDFPISVLGNQARGETSGTVAHYLTLLQREIAATPAGEASLETVFFGGGTPSLLSPGQVDQILTCLDQRVGLAPGAEISMEIDPGTFDLERLRGYRAAGINRVSLGVQALEDRLLAACGRDHRRQDVDQAVTWLHRLGLENWSLDLIAGLPQQQLEDWQRGLTQATAFAPHHISVYDLTLEPQTVFGKRYRPGDAPLPTEEQTAAMYRLTHQSLEDLGYDHYEVSNYARPGHRCRHNLTYWHNQPYYGFGMGATSYTQQQRVSRPRTLANYGAWVEQFEARLGQHPDPTTPPLDQFLETLMLGLRLRQGIEATRLRSQSPDHTWEQLGNILKGHVARGWVITEGPSWGELDRLRLSAPEGFLFSNQILADCFALGVEAP